MPGIELSEGERVVLAAMQLLKPAFERLRATLPSGTDFGILILVPGSDPRETPVIAMTTDRRLVGLAAARWILDAEPFDAEPFSDGAEEEGGA